MNEREISLLEREEAKMAKEEQIDLTEKLATTAEKEVMSLFKYGYFDTILAARCGVSLKRVIELRDMYNLFKAKGVK